MGQAGDDEIQGADRPGSGFPSISTPTAGSNLQVTTSIRDTDPNVQTQYNFARRSVNADCVKTATLGGLGNSDCRACRQPASPHGSNDMTLATTIFWAILFCCVLAVGWVMTVLALPGNWLIVAAAAVYAGLIPAEESRLALGWPTVAALAVLAVVGELVELLAAARGVRQAGGSRWSA